MTLHSRDPFFSCDPSITLVSSSLKASASAISDKLVGGTVVQNNSSFISSMATALDGCIHSFLMNGF